MTNPAHPETAAANPAIRQFLTTLPAWKSLAEHHQQVGGMHLRQIFADDPHRGERYHAQAAGIYLDYSKQRVTGETLRLLMDLARECGLKERIEAMFSGEPINVTEARSVLHTALRAPATERIVVEGADVVPEVHAVLGQMRRFSDEIRSGRWLGHSGKRIRNVVNIGIGGSDLGPAMAFESLRHYADPRLTVRFISNVDGTAFAEAIP